MTGARKGSLTVMVSGPKAAFEAIEGLLKVFGRLFFIGEKAGMGQTMKLANNLIAATSLAVTCEAAVMGEKAGLDLKTMIDVLNVSSGRSSATDDKFPRAILPRTYDFGFTTGLSYKDVQALPGRGGGARDSHGGGRRDASDAGDDGLLVRERFRLHLDDEERGASGRPRPGRLMQRRRRGRARSVPMRRLPADARNSAYFAAENLV